MKMDLRLAFIIVRLSITVSIICLALQLTLFPEFVSGQMDWAEDDDDPGKFFFLSLISTFFITHFFFL